MNAKNIALCCTLALAACGGGGASFDSPPAAPLPGPAGTLQLTAAAATIAEASGSVSFTVSRTGGTEGALAATLATSDGTATAGQDYTGQSVQLTFPAGSASSQTVSIPISGDTRDEPDETLMLTLTSSAQGTPVTASVTIVDDDPPATLQLTQPTFSTGEGGGTVTVVVERTGDVFGAVSANVATRDASALAGADYQSTAATVSFAAGDSAAKNVTIPIVDDGDVEVEETFEVLLSDPTGGAVLGATTTATVMIAANDAPPNPPSSGQPGSLQLSAASYDISESGGNVLVSVTRVGGSGGAVSATLTTSNGSALAASDYTALSTTVSWAAGDAATKLIQIAIVGDSVAELTEAFTVTLSAPAGGATLGTPSVASVQVQDNDRPALPVVSFGIETKRVRFDWLEVPTVTAYRLYHNPDGSSGFTQVGTDIAPASLSANFDLTVHRFDWRDASFRLDACNAVGCTSSEEISITDGMLDAIGYLKAEGVDASDLLGGSVASSADGSIVAVGVPFEDSGSTGTSGGNPNNDSVANSGAVYVYARADGAWVQQAYIKASSVQVNDLFGGAVALSGDGATLAVGATGRTGGQGIVYVFTRAGADWTQRAALSASNPSAGDAFGAGLALSSDGSTLAVGAPLEDGDATGINGPDNDNAIGAGAAYAFARNGDSWTQTAYIKASNTQADDVFAASVALNADGTTLVIGANGEDGGDTQINGNQGDNTAPNAGAVYVFTRAGAIWAQTTYLKAPNAEAADSFGTAVALSADGNTLAIGAPLEDGNEKGALVFPLPPPPAVPPPPPPDPTPTFREICDNPVTRPTIACESGAVYVFVRTAGVWTAQSYLKGRNNAYEDRVGASVALSADGNTVAFGAPNEDSSALGVEGNDTLDDAPGAGAAHVFVRAGALWSQASYVKAFNADSADTFGTAIALSGDAATLVVGATFEASGVPSDPNDDSASGAGAAYLY